MELKDSLFSYVKGAKVLLLAFILSSVVVSCNNKPSSSAAATSQSDSTTSSKGTGAKTTADTSNGTAAMPAQVYDDLKGLPISGAAVAAQQNGQVVETATSDVNGNYAYKTLTNGAIYTFVASKTGWQTQTLNAAYQGTNSLPAFPMVMLKK